MSTRHSISLFGPGQVVDLQGAALAMRSRKQLAMLAYLASEYSIAHTREALMALFWPDETTANAQNNLRVALSRLKEMASKTGAEDVDLLRVDRHTVQLHSAWVGRVDVNAFEALLTRTRQHSHAHRNQCAHCQAALKEAVNLYAGEFLSGLVLDDCTELAEWLFVQRERLRTQVIESYADLATFAETSNDLSAALEYAQCLIELDPLRELAYRQQMRVWAKRGNRNAALAAYARCRQQVQEALGIEPEPETQHLHAQILSGEMALVPQKASTTSPRHNLPQQLTSFVGRDDELAQLHERLTQPNNRLLSLIGPGGVGKTRLALQLALQLAQQIAAQPLMSFDDGVCFVPLAQVTTIEAIPSAIAEALHLLISPSEQSALDQLIAQIGNKHLLLVLDNFEHLMDGTGLLVTLLQRTPNTVLLVTSRERLDLVSEDCIELAGLPTPANANDASADQYAAVRLFVDRAYRRSKQFKLSAEERPHVVRICRLVEGFPLGIELAATWVGDFNCQEIVQALSSGLHDLKTTACDIEPARRSLRAVFQTSWRLLSEAEQRTLAALSVFQGGFSKAAALAVAGATQGLLSALRRKSLLRHDGSLRYRTAPAQQNLLAEPLIAWAMCQGRCEAESVASLDTSPMRFRI
jgi:predicted ATPase/two-component SAPR family response regulator